jgi:aldehyde dehydrogenase (NAD+)
VAKWAKDEKRQTPMMIAPGSSKVINEPLGVVLIMSAWNFPLVTSFCPLAAAIAAGNSAIIKPSEMAPHTAALVGTLISKYLDSGCFSVITGGPEVAQSIVQAKFDMIVFTGSPQKGKLVAEAAAKNLIPCILELGGKCPVIVDDSADIDHAAKKIVFGRYTNSGQICLSPDYVLVKSTVKDQLIEKMKHYIDVFFENN